MGVNNVDYSRLIYLNKKLKDNVASKLERDEYMDILLKNGNITTEQYNNYKNNSSNKEEVVNAALTIGGIMLVAYLLDKLISR